MHVLSRYFAHNLRRRFLLANGTFLLATMLFVAGLFFYQIRSGMREELDRRGAELARVLASETWLLLTHDRLHAGNEPEGWDAATLLTLETQAVSAERDAAFAEVTDDAGTVLAFGGKRGASLSGHEYPLVFERRVCDAHNPALAMTSEEARVHQSCPTRAIVRVGILPGASLGRLDRALWTSLALAGVLVLLGLIASLVLTRWTLRPVTAMAAAARAVAAGDLTRRVTVNSRDEIGALAEAFNEMTWSLADSQEELARRNSELQMVALEKERLYKNAQVRATRLQVTGELAKAMASSLDPEEIYGHVHRQLSRLMEYEYITIERYLPEKLQYRRDYVWIDKPVEGVTAGQLVAADDSPIRRVQQTRMPLSIPDFDRDRMLSEGWLREAGFRSGFIVPIVAQGEFLGILGLACRRKNAFARMEVATVFAIADTLAVVLKSAELYQRLQQSFLELKEAQSRLAQSEGVRRAEKLRSVGQMASGIAHNFNNVMSAIVGRVQLMKLKAVQKRLDAAELTRGLDVVERAALDGAETVRRLQEFSRGESIDEPEKADLKELIRAVIEITRPRWKDQAEQKGRRITVETDLRGAPLVACVPGEVREVLTNLMFNAVDALPEGGTIRLFTESDETTATVRVEDDGEGIPAEVREHIFDPFYTTKGVGGSGLGLSTVYGIVERHGGTISVESALGQGTRFTLEFPLVSAAAKEKASRDLPRSQAWRILVGDDEESVREALADLLRLLGHEVRTAASGEGTVAAFGEGTFDLVFTDLGMPGMSGWEVAESIRKVDTKIPIILATGWGTTLDEREAAGRGITRVLGKPFTIQKISSLIAELQGMRKAA